MSVALTSDRLILRPARRDDAASYAAGIGNPVVARMLNPIPLPYTEAMARDWIDTLPDPHPENATFIIDLPGTGLIGGVGFRAELGYWLAEPHWGKGYATEACASLLDWLFAASDIDWVPSGAHADNPASARVQQKLGFAVVGHAEKFSEARQCVVPHIVTELSRTVWFGRTPQ